jgi:hypothetical protein
VIPPLVLVGLAVLIVGVVAICLGSFRTKDVGLLLFLVALVVIAVGAGTA